MKVISYNIHKGFSASNTKFILKGIREAIKATDADLVFLQEVVGHNQKHAENLEEWPTQPQFEFLADTVWSHYAYGRNAIYTSANHGNAILSKYPILSWENIDVSSHPLEKRGILHAVIEIPDSKEPEPLHLLCIHFGLFEFSRQQQLQMLAERIKSAVPKNAPLIVGGDFNDWRERASDYLLQEIGLQEAYFTYRGKHARTYPAILPLFHMDRIYFRGLEVKDAKVFRDRTWRKLSDHSAVYAEFTSPHWP